MRELLPSQIHSHLISKKVSECPANRYVFGSSLNCSESTAGFCRWSGNKFQIVSRATEMHRSQGEHVELTADDIWQIADVGDQKLRRLAVKVLDLAQITIKPYQINTPWAKKCATLFLTTRLMFLVDFSLAWKIFDSSVLSVVLSVHNMTFIVEPSK